MTVKQADKKRLKTLTLAEVEEAICEKGPNHYLDHKDWAHDCHTVSLAIVNSDLFESARVARGSCRGVLGQHSWVVLGDDCYDRTAPILDATLWSYDDQHPVLWKGSLAKGLHHPHGEGSIFAWGKPTSGGGEPITLDGLSAGAAQFMRMLGPLDARGWMSLFSAPVEGWPSKEIIAAAYRHDRLRALIPIDRVGMLTDLNPQGLYRKSQEVQV